MTRLGLLLFYVLIVSCSAYQPGSTRRTAGEVVDDTIIETAVNAKVVGDKELSVFDIDVDARAGAVILYGHVASSEQEARVVELARTIKGVKSVESRLVIVPPQ